MKTKQDLPVPNDILRRQYITKGIYGDMGVNIEEVPRKIFFGSTDRKGYTVKISVVYLNKIMESYIDVEPFFSDYERKIVIERAVEEAKRKMADEINNLIKP